MRFFLFGCFWDHFATTQNSKQNRSHWCNYWKSSYHDVLLQFHATNAPDLHHWTLNSCFGVFVSVWVHMRPFCYFTKLGVKWSNLVQLMQKFVPLSLVRISQNERYGSTQLDPKLMFSSVSFRLGAFGTASLPHKTRSKTGQSDAINAKVCARMSC